ncbi:MAG: SPOR domain-containing protein [candidate division Zixibacteria bacterium]|nr:SPOR domain-containing protein [candidate division Zixibacteria bacterium]
MRRLVSICSISVIAATLISTSCLKPAGEAGRTAPGGDRALPGTERFDPLDMPGDMNVVPRSNPQSGPVTGHVAFVESDSAEYGLDLADVTQVPDDVDSASNQAYRVQIFTSKVFGEAQHARKIAEEIFDRPVTADYEVPYFKVRVGSFRSREEAEEYALRAKAAGYRDAWVVVVNVNVRQPALLYDGELPMIYEADSLFDESPGLQDE